MPPVYYNDPDLIWIQEAMILYDKSRGTLMNAVREGRLTKKDDFYGDTRMYLYRSELNKLFGEPPSNTSSGEKRSS